MQKAGVGAMKRIAERDAFSGKWLKMRLFDYTVRGKVIQNYEAVERTTRKQSLDYDGVDVVAILRKSAPSDTTNVGASPQLILIANYRPPVDKFVLEFPAGLMDDSNLEENALRELREETGYVGTIDKSTFTQFPPPTVYGDPWKSNESAKLVFVEVDEGQTPLQQLESTEDIKVFLVPLDANLYQHLLKLAEENGFVILEKVWSFALGLKYGSQFLGKV